ncbi:MAG: ferritin-like domain-containing protein [Hyphomicrobiaceae bacterium]
MSQTLADHARAIVCATDLDEKTALAKQAAQLWHRRRLALVKRSSPERMPERPGRPEGLRLLAPREMPRRSLGGDKGRIAHLHALAHIELSAIDMTWDLIGRFAAVPVPHAFFDDWVRVGVEEAKHFELLAGRLDALGARYGSLPVHDGLWQAAQATGASLLARVAVVPLVLEARGLDVGPAMIEKAHGLGDAATARILEIIYRDEKRHVAFGLKWFRFLCEREGREPEPTFHALVRTHFRGPVKPPFNDRARAEAGLTPGFYRPLAALGH